MNLNTLNNSGDIAMDNTFRGEIIMYQTDDGLTKIDVQMHNETVWLSLDQIAELFQRDKSTISRHIRNIFTEGELDRNVVVAKYATTAADGKTYQVDFYNLDVIISAGYRVKSQRGTQFRIWANSVLKKYITDGYVVNQSRINELHNVIQIIKRTDNLLDTKQVLDVVERYTTALDLLDDYDHQRITKPDGSEAIYVLGYDECRSFINNQRFATESKLFGIEKDESFRSSIAAIYQSFGGEDVYPTAEEKAANLLYFITKNHSFTDGNKRIAAALFLYFLDKNNMLIRNGQKIIDDYTLVAITIMIAESRPEEKETMVNLVMNFIC